MSHGDRSGPVELEDWHTRLVRVFGPGDDLYRDLIRLSPAPMILEDWSQAKPIVEAAREAAGDDVEAHVLAHPELAEQFYLAMGYIAANPAMLAVNRATDESAYLAYLQSFEARMAPTMAAVMDQLAAGRFELCWPEVYVEAFDGADTLMRGCVFIPPSHRHDWSLAIGTFEDITAMRATETALRQAKDVAERSSAARAEFVANMSHEFRTPLNAIIGFAQVLRDEMFGPLGSDRYSGYIGDILQSGEHLLDLVNDLLDLARADAGRMELEEAEIDPTVLIAQTLRFVRDRATRQRLVLETHIPENLPWLRADGRRMRQALLNLLTNAVKFTPRGGRVDVTASIGTAGGLAISVADSGVGMTARDIAIAMEPFGQAHRSHRGRLEGTGLGLPIASRIVELHGGRLEITSTPKSGTTATILLPSSRIARP